MRLSEAIRLGATMKPQCAGQLRQYDAEGNESTCAIGAALNAIGLKASLTAFVQGWPHDWVDMQELLMPVACPACAAEPDSLFRSIADSGGMIEHLNDIHCWTREAIADFVELHEPQPEPEMLPEIPDSDIQTYWLSKSGLFV